MAKRFGRNQKRRTREQLSSLARQTEMDAELILYQRKRLDSYDDWSRRLDDLVPRFSVLRKDVETVCRDRDPGDAEYLAELSKLPSRAFDPVGPSDIVQTTYERIRMNVMKVEAERDRFRRGLHFRVNVRDQAAYYMVDDTLLDQIGIGEEARRFIASEISDQLTRYLQPSR